MLTAAQIVTAILAMFPAMSGNNRECIIARRTRIENHITAAQRQFPEMPSEVFASIGFIESHFGCNPRSGGSWGVPISPSRRNIAGTPLQAASVLWHSYQACHTWDGAARRFRTGLCRPTTVGTRYSRIATNLTNRIRMQVNSAR